MQLSRGIVSRARSVRIHSMAYGHLSYQSALKRLGSWDLSVVWAQHSDRTRYDIFWYAHLRVKKKHALNILRTLRTTCPSSKLPE